MNESAGSLVLTGRVWLFGDDVNTDDMYPGFAMRLDTAEAAEHMFNASRPGWSKQVKPGDILVGGLRFGLGSARPVGSLMQHLGIACILAEQFNSLFMRNAINFGIPALTVPGVREGFTEGDEARVDVATAEIRNLSTGGSLRGVPLPDLVLDLVRHGGIEGSLRHRGLLD